jgi:hypothetical protein
MSFQLKPLAALYTTLESLIQHEFKFTEDNARASVQRLQNNFRKFKKDLWVGIETSYIDKLYRDTYYHYYSSKLKYYSRETIRLTFFSEEISINEFYSQEGQQKLQSSFLGFVVLRPTQNIFGRNVLSPNVFDRTDTYHICRACYEICVHGAKILVHGFPHSSQDGEFMVCAETTVWSLMEYFSTRYAEYHPILPKTIHQILSVTSMQRQVPSTGLTALQISYALKETGFGVKNYIDSGLPDFKTIIKIYIESGIPVVVAIKNDRGIAHVFNIAGRTDYASKDFEYEVLETLSDNVNLLNYYDAPAKYLAIDDNQTPYDSIVLEDPSGNYASENWKGCKIIAAIIPLHRRIYKDAQKAQGSAIQHLKWLVQNTKLPADVVLRLLLSSSRSFKSSIAKNPDLPDDIKTLILSIDMPKFVWIAETGTPASYGAGKATGMILMDATEPNKSETLACFVGNVYIGTLDNKIGVYDIPLPAFQMHTNLNAI